MSNTPKLRLVGSKCIVCGKHCEPYELNTDGSWAHAHCLKQHLARPSTTSEKDGS